MRRFAQRSGGSSGTACASVATKSRAAPPAAATSAARKRARRRRSARRAHERVQRPPREIRPRRTRQQADPPVEAREDAARAVRRAVVADDHLHLVFCPLGENGRKRPGDLGLVVARANKDGDQHLSANQVPARRLRGGAGPPDARPLPAPPSRPRRRRPRANACRGRSGGSRRPSPRRRP